MMFEPALAPYIAVAYIVLSYLIGSVPTAYIVAKKLKDIDIREHGSGNVGATNVMRVVGKKAGIFVLVCDFFKGFIPVAAAQILFPGMDYVPVAVALMTIVGHSRSIFLGFSGGKSAITGLGTVFALNPLGGLLVGGIAFTLIKVTRYVSVGSMTAALIAPLIFWLLGSPKAYVFYTLASSLYVVYLHRANIQRLIRGAENKLQ